MPLLVIVLLLTLGSVAVIWSSAADIDLNPVRAADGLTSEESAYYEYVGPRLDRLVQEVDDVVTMVDARSRDILALTISGERIERLSDEVRAFGEANSVPARLESIHLQILAATDVISYTFAQARQAMRTLNFSRMAELVVDFERAASELHEAQHALQAIADGTEDAR